MAFYWIPYKSMKIDVPLSPEELDKQLTCELSTQYFDDTALRLLPPNVAEFLSWFGTDTVEFRGHVDEVGFLVHQHIVGRPVVPYLYGRFFPTADGTHIRIRITGHWLSMIGFCLLPFLIALFSLEPGVPFHRALAATEIPFIVTAVCCYGVTIFAYNLHIRTAVRFIEKAITESPEDQLVPRKPVQSH